MVHNLAMDDASDPFSLAGRTALVTGASRGIGAATAVALDRAGARVAVAARDEAELEKVAAGLGHDPVVLVADLGGRDEPAGLARRAIEALGPIDILVNNAAAAARLPTVDTDADLIDRLLAVNVRAPLLLVAGLVPAMIERGGARSSTSPRCPVSSALRTGRPMPPRRVRSTRPRAHWRWSSAATASG